MMTSGGDRHKILSHAGKIAGMALSRRMREGGMTNIVARQPLAGCALDNIISAPAQRATHFQSATQVIPSLSFVLFPFAPARGHFFSLIRST